MAPKASGYRHRRWEGVRGVRPLLGGVVGLVGVLLLAACTPPLLELNDAQELQADEVVLVGRVELTPPLAEHEKKQAGNIAVDENSMLFYIHSKPTPIGDPPRVTEAEHWLAATYGKTFYVRSPLRRTYFTIGLLQLQQGSSIEALWLPARFYVEAQPGDRAVYIGTLRYHRNAYFDITKVELIDAYAKEQKAFEAKFGKGLKLVRRKPQSFQVPEAN